MEEAIRDGSTYSPPQPSSIRHQRLKPISSWQVAMGVLHQGCQLVALEGRSAWRHMVEGSGLRNTILIAMQHCSQ